EDVLARGDQPPQHPDRDPGGHRSADREHRGPPPGGQAPGPRRRCRRRSRLRSGHLASAAGAVRCPTVDSSESTSTPISALMIAVITPDCQCALLTSGSTTAATMIRPTIHWKNTIGEGTSAKKNHSSSPATIAPTPPISAAIHGLCSPSTHIAPGAWLV